MATQNLFNLSLHQSTTYFCHHKNGIHNYVIVRVPGGWLYNNVSLGTSVFVPYTEELTEEDPNIYHTGKSTHEVAESLPGEVREAIDNLNDEQRSELLRILSERKLD